MKYNPNQDAIAAVLAVGAAEASAANPVPVTGVPGTPADKSGTITAGGTAQVLAAVSATRLALFVSNPDATNDLWIAGVGLTAAANGQGAIRVPANGGSIALALPDPVRTAWTIVGAITGQKFTAWEA